LKEKKDMDRIKMSDVIEKLKLGNWISYFLKIILNENGMVENLSATH
jgi:hypothetical protein